jgi:HK97 family phage major capsid protein
METIETLKKKIADAQDEARRITEGTWDSRSKSRVDVLLSNIKTWSNELKTLTTTDDERRQRAVQAFGPDALLSKEERGSVRSLLLSPSGEQRTYTGMSVATDTAGGDFVPQDFYSKLTFALKKTDALFDDSVVTVWKTEAGNAAQAAFVDDTSAAASVVSENTNGTETEIATIGRLSFGKTPTWRSGKLFASMELLQDAAFPVEDALIVPAVAKRFQRGIGAANVTTLLNSITSGATSNTTGTVVMDDVLALLESVDPEYLESPKAFIGMNHNVMLSLMRQTSTTGSLIWKPRYDSNGRPLLANIPVVILPSLANVATGSKSVVCGDFSRCVRRQVQSVRVIRYEQAPNLVENGIVGYQGFLRSDFGVLTSASSDAPIKFLTTK